MRCATIRELSGIRNQLAERLLQTRPSAFIGVDAPDFNLGLEARLKHAGIKAIHFVCPSIWAWRGGRVKRIARSVDHVLCLFPFEPELLQRHGIAATYVGHPLADVIPLQVPRAEARLKLGLGDERCRGRGAAGQPPGRDPPHRASPSCRPRRCCIGSGRSCASCCRWRRACARRWSR